MATKSYPNTDRFFTEVQRFGDPSFAGALARQEMQQVSFAGTRAGTDNRGWKLRMKANRNAGSPFSADRLTVKITDPGSYRLDWYSTAEPHRKYWEIGSGVKVTPFLSLGHLPTSAAEAEAAALKKIYSRIRSERTSVNGFTFLGELREAMHMIRRPASALLTQVEKHFNSLEKHKRSVLKLPVHKRRAEWSKAVAGSTLEINFGWAPLVSDAKAIAEGIARMVEQPPRKKRLQAQGLSNDSWSDQSLMDDPNVSGWGVYRLNRLMKTERSVRYTVGLDNEVQVADNALSRLQDSFGFKLEDFVPTIYELTPWSWLIDYFSNLGDLIEAGSTDTTMVKWVIRTEQVRTSFDANAIPVGHNLSRAYSGGTLRQISGTGGAVQVVRRTVTRTCPASLGLPPLVFTHPGESFKKMANILSVLAQRRKGLQDLSYMPTYGTKSVHFR